MPRTRLTARKRVTVAAPTYSLARWLEQPVVECHHKGTGYFPSELEKVHKALGYHELPLYTAVRTPVRGGHYSWKVRVTLFERCTADGVRRVRRVHHATAARCSFRTGMADAARQALAVLRYEENDMSHSQYKYFAQRESGTAEEYFSDPEAEGYNMKTQVRYSEALSDELTDALDELADTHVRNRELEDEVRQLKAVIAGQALEDEPLEEPAQDPVPPASPERYQLRH